MPPPSKIFPPNASSTKKNDTATISKTPSTKRSVIVFSLIKTLPSPTTSPPPCAFGQTTTSSMLSAIRVTSPSLVFSAGFQLIVSVSASTLLKTPADAQLKSSPAGTLYAKSSPMIAGTKLGTKTPSQTTLQNLHDCSSGWISRGMRLSKITAPISKNAASTRRPTKPSTSLSTRRHWIAGKTMRLKLRKIFLSSSP